MEINRENGSTILYDRNGIPAVYIDSDEEYIYPLNGKPTAYLNEDAVYGFGGAQYGWFEKGQIKGLNGYCVMFADEAKTQGPVKPSHRKTLAKRARTAGPVRRSREIERSRTAYKAVWLEIVIGDSLSGNS